VHFLATILLGVAVYLRPQYLPLLAVYLFLFYYYRQPTKPIRYLFIFLSGVFAGLFLGGLTDYLHIGSWFHSFYTYLSLNLGRGAALVNDPATPTQMPRLFYFSSLITTSFFLSLFAIVSPRKYRPLLLIPLITILLHTLVDHKEYRFIFASLPILISLGLISMYQLVKTWLSTTNALVICTTIFIGISIMGFNHLIPGQRLQYYYPLRYFDPVLHVFEQAGQITDICGLYDATRTYEVSGSYYFLGKNIPIYNQTYPPRLNHPQVNLIITSTPKELENYLLLDSQPSLYLYYSKTCDLTEKDNLNLQLYP
jgi:hypothetical protein